ncbi:MAG: dTDP-4-dehydrorhamnose 3,5-epimerase [Sphingomonadaceae bacterium]|nr:dTDP-4-dehydrorhamnose 3,5-epimerase [Sphingomonadaceae bacterium]
MRVTPAAIADVMLIEPTVHGDDRGFFMETWNTRDYAQAGINAAFVQDNHSKSARGVLRGLHYQVERPQGKLVRVVAGAVFDVAIDLRRSSPTFGRWVGYELSAANKRQLWLPAGFAHGFVTLANDTEFLYKCTDFYAPEQERCIRWDDPALAIDWPVASPSLSMKDAAGTTLADAEGFA